MKLSVELTYYPLQQTDHIAAIKQVIDKLNSYSDIKVETFPTATVVMGDYPVVMAMLNEVIAWGYNQFGRSVFVAKFLPSYEAL
ncbi:histidine kinase [Teredinibacter turnerae]|uniref:Histidine kinase n=1 Tax=Teredinibacter turnerae (strain ATCC 39867 / T7901) TaxID=377629 RepID=C5BRT8_TERTT|nr:histidine kinase [Teredinibacter turnerae]ACR12188.1 histidine kinase [Teredinibacter turnerae T7901]